MPKTLKPLGSQQGHRRNTLPSLHVCRHKGRHRPRNREALNTSDMDSAPRLEKIRRAETSRGYRGLETNTAEMLLKFCPLKVLRHAG